MQEEDCERRVSREALWDEVVSGGSSGCEDAWGAADVGWDIGFVAFQRWMLRSRLLRMEDNAATARRKVRDGAMIERTNSRFHHTLSQSLPAFHRGCSVPVRPSRRSSSAECPFRVHER